MLHNDLGCTDVNVGNLNAGPEVFKPGDDGDGLGFNNPVSGQGKVRQTHKGGKIAHSAFNKTSPLTV